jgi:glycerol-3-phosphate dehydrogenase
MSGFPSEALANNTETKVFDIAVIGGGVVGCAVLRAFTLAGASSVLLERGADILSGASKGNSAILHTGFDAPTGSLEHRCIREGYQEYLQIHEKLNLPLVKSSALMIAWTDEQARALPSIVDKAHANGVADVTRISLDELRRREPNLSPAAKGALHIPGESFIDPWSTPLAYVHQALANGARVYGLCEVRSGKFNNDFWRLKTSRGAVKARTVINCAGNFGDRVEEINRPSPFEIKPRKGQFLVYDKPAADLFNAIILPVPGKRTKGVLLFRSVFGNVLVGPTAEDQKNREFAGVTEEVLRELKKKGESILPNLAEQNIIATFAALRPATQFNDYQIQAMPDRGWITVGGIRSTGLSSSLGIAKYLLNLYEEAFGKLVPLEQIKWTRVPNLAEHLPRPFQQLDAGELICFCEMVTRQEIEDTFSSICPPGDMGGLKRRTRCCLGRCQGYYCGYKVAHLVRGRLKAPLSLEEPS